MEFISLSETLFTLGTSKIKVILNRKSIDRVEIINTDAER